MLDTYKLATVSLSIDLIGFNFSNVAYALYRTWKWI